MKTELSESMKLRIKRLKMIAPSTASTNRKAELSAMVMRMSTNQIVNYIYDMEIRAGHHI